MLMGADQAHCRQAVADQSWARSPYSYLETYLGMASVLSFSSRRSTSRSTDSSILVLCGKCSFNACSAVCGILNSVDDSHRTRSITTILCNGSV